MSISAIIQLSVMLLLLFLINLLQFAGFLVGLPVCPSIHLLLQSTGQISMTCAVDIHGPQRMNTIHPIFYDLIGRLS